MKRIPLTKEHFAIVDDSDFDFLSQWKWCVCHGKYAKRNDWKKGNKTIYMHRLILGVGSGVQVDHIDRNGLNNRRSNLRVATQSQNSQNVGISRQNTSGFKGVSWDKSRKKWMASIRGNGKFTNLGRFVRIADAVNAYDAAALKYFGDFALTNGKILSNA